MAGDDEQFRSVALQIAAQEARAGRGRLATELRDLVDEAQLKTAVVERQGPTPIAQARGELSGLVEASYPQTRLDAMVLSDEASSRLLRVIHEQRQAHVLESHGLRPRRKLLLVGPPGVGKTMTASALAGELKLPLFTTLLEGVITKYLGETAVKLRTIFDAMNRTRGVFLFDEFDAIGAKRNAHNDVGEVRRVLNSFLQLLENDRSSSLIVCATNHPELLDRALFRRFDDVLRYAMPDTTTALAVLRTRLSGRKSKAIRWTSVGKGADGLSQADLARAADEASKASVLRGEPVSTETLIQALEERKSESHRGDSLRTP